MSKLGEILFGKRRECPEIQTLNGERLVVTRLGVLRRLDIPRPIVLPEDRVKIRKVVK